MFRFYLNNTLVEDALNWADFTETIERDDIIKGLLPKYETKLTFNGGGYKFLYDLMKSSGFCNLVNLKIDYKCGQNYDTVLSAYIFISDCRFNLNKCTVECDVIDDNYGARIFNNKSLSAKINVGFSKNGEVITPATATSLSIYSTTNTLIGTRDAYQIKDIFRFLVDFMTDGLMGFESTFLTSGLAETAGWIYLSSGKNLRIDDGTPITISFQDLFQEINKKYPISFTIINVGGLPTMKIENDSYFYSSSNSITINNVNDLQQSFNTELLYSKIKLGGVSADYSAILGSFPIIRFFSFVEEEYQLQGECNIDKTLDLTGTYIADSNIVERLTATETGNDQYDENVIFIESSDDLGSLMTDSLITLANPLYYNANLTNNNVSERYSLASNIAFYLGSNSESFLATRTTQQYIAHLTYNYYSTAILFDDDSTLPNFDTAGTYNPVNGRYTSVADGVYGFEAKVFFYILLTVFPQTRTWGVAFRVFDSGGVLQATHLGTLTTASISGGVYSAIANKTINVLSGYYVTVHWYIDITSGSGLAGSMRIYPNSYFKTTSIQNGGGVYEYKDADDYFVSKLEFKTPISKDSYDTLKLDLSKSIIVNHDGVSNKTAWIRKTVRTYSSGETNLELISNITNSQ